jgi:hypothetical protein
MVEIMAPELKSTTKEDRVAAEDPMNITQVGKRAERERGP